MPTKLESYKVPDEDKLSELKVLLLEDDPDLASILKLFIEKSYRCFSYSSFEDLVNAGEEALQCDVAILDLDLGRNRPTGIDGLRWLQKEDFAGQIVFLTAHGQNHPLMEQICPSIKVFSKPIAPNILLESIGGAPA